MNEVQRDSEEWFHMWNVLASNSINSGESECIHPESGEVWQYMGTKNGIHSFRHRHHPATGKIEYAHIQARS